MTRAFDDFVWSVGEEGSDPIVGVDGRNVRHDQFAQSGHYDNQLRDLQDIADLGVRVVRYGTPWRFAEPAPGVYDWSHWDRALAACARAELEPVVEFVHFGLPDHYPGFADDAWVDGFYNYVDAFIARYGEPTLFTPINEPGVTALLSARFGLWNDRLASPKAHARALANVVAANLEAMSQLRADRDARWIGSEGFSIYVGDNPQTTHRRNLEWLVWDLHLGVAPPDELASYFDAVPDRTLERIAKLTMNTDLVAGLDIYPATIRTAAGEEPTSIDEQIALALTEIRRWHKRYGQPFWIAETSNLSLPITDQVAWLDSFAVGLGQLRSEGLPARGLCWYSRGDQFDWQTALANPTGAVTEVGLFDTKRVARPVAHRFAELAGAGAPQATPAQDR